MNYTKARAAGSNSMSGKSSLNQPVSMDKTEIIRKVAQDLYVKKGCQPGHDMENWLEAEKLVKSGKV